MVAVLVGDGRGELDQIVGRQRGRLIRPAVRRMHDRPRLIEGDGARGADGDREHEHVVRCEVRPSTLPLPLTEQDVASPVNVSTRPLLTPADSRQARRSARRRPRRRRVASSGPSLKSTA